MSRNDMADVGVLAVTVAAVYVADHPNLLGGYRQQVITIDAAHNDEAALRSRLGQFLHAGVHRMVVEKVDLEWWRQPGGSAGWTAST